MEISLKYIIPEDDEARITALNQVQAGPCYRVAYIQCIGGKVEAITKFEIYGMIK